MGAQVSHPPIAESPHILAFHSSAAWKAHFDVTKQSTQLMVINFTATWCGPCRSMYPTMNELAKTLTDVVFVKIDVDELREVAQEWGVEAMPTYLLVKEGKEVDRVVGAKKEELEKKIHKHREQLHY